MNRVLVVDDSPIELLLGKTLLESMGYQVFTSDSGQAALERMQEAKPQLVICDMTMPDMSGIELVEASKYLEPRPLFIMATSLDDAETAVSALHAGAYGYLTKPLRPESLRKSIDHALKRYQLEQDNLAHIDRLSRFDALTGLANQTEFQRQLHTIMDTMSHDVLPCALIFVNVNGLSQVNNTLGHQAGDQVLQQVAGVLKSSTRQEDCVGRYAGDVFAVLLRRISPERLLNKLEQLHEQVEANKLELHGKPMTITISTGCMLAMPNDTADTLLTNADLALHLAKRRGRNTYHVYQPEDDSLKQELGEQLNGLEVIRRAIVDQRFEMHFQPIVDLHSGTTRHYEALIRFFDEAGKLIPPGELIKTAENFGLITKLDCLVVDACLKEIVRLSPHIPDRTGISINLSGKSLGDPGLLRVIEQGLASTGVDPTRVIFELTETAAFYNLDGVQRFVRHVRSLGCRFALDDFGVGFSSFYYIKQLEFDYLKIDGSFVKNLPDNPTDQVFIRAMVQISKVFGMKVIAEWVENQEIADLLREFGVDLGQGYHFGRPSRLATVSQGILP